MRKLCTTSMICAVPALAAVTVVLAEREVQVKTIYDTSMTPDNTFVGKVTGDPFKPVGTVAGDVCSFSNGNPVDCFGAPASQEDPGTGNEQFFAEAADDFIIEDAASPNNPCLITSITTWISFFGGDGLDHPEGITGFHITIYEETEVDGLAQPAGRPIEDGTGTHDQALATQFAPLSDLVITQIMGGKNTGDYYQVDISNLGLYVPKNRKLWMALAPQYDFETFGQVAIRLSDTNTGSPAVQIFPAAGLPDWDATGGNSGCPDIGDTGTLNDLAFIVNGIKDPGQPPDGPCPADCGGTGDGFVTTVDLLALLSQFTPAPAGSCDIVGPGMTPPDGIVDTVDLLAMLAAWGQCPFIAPDNDECTDQEVLTEGTSEIDLKGATNSSPAPQGTNSGGDIWYCFTPAITGTLVLQTNVDIYAEAYAGCVCAPLGAVINGGRTQIGNGSGGVRVSVVAGESVLIRLINDRDLEDGFGIKGALTATVIAIEECADRATLAVGGGPISGDTFGSEGSDDVGPGCGAFSQDAPGHWYSVTGPAGGAQLTATLSIENAQIWDGVVSVYCGRCDGPLLCVGECAPFQPLGCANIGAATSTATVSWCAEDGEEYFVLVHSVQNAIPDGGPYTLEVANDGVCIDDPPECGPPNDDCFDMIEATSGVTPFDTSLATTDGPESPAGTCNDFGQPQTWEDLWWYYQAECTGVLLYTTCEELIDPTQDVPAPTYDTDLVVYGPFDDVKAAIAECTSGNLVDFLIGCNDDDPVNACGTGAPWSSTVETVVEQGKIYVLRAGGWGEGNAGLANFLVECTPGVPEGACCFNDQNCTDSITEADCDAAAMSNFWLEATSCVDITCPPAVAASDSCAGANDITDFIDGAFALQANNFGATPPQNDGGPGDPELPVGSPSCHWAGTPTDTFATIWYTFVAPSTDIHVLTCNSGGTAVDSTIGIYSGTCGSLVEIGCGEDECDPNFMSDTGVITGLTPGETYYLMLACPGGWGGNVPGEFSIEITTN